MRRIAGALLLALIASTCVATPSPPGPTERVPARALGGQPMRECAVGATLARCGSLLVAVDPSRPEGRRVDLRVVVVPATDATTRPAALFLVTGGPGGASTSSFAWAPVAFAGLRPTHDLVMVDQRGTGGSDQLRLPRKPDVAGVNGAARQAAITAWARAGFAALPEDVAFYTTRAAADDLDAVRAALGYESVDVYGASYGATVAQYYARQHGAHLRSLVLDGGTLLDVPVLELIAPNVQRALDLLFMRCASDALCAAAYPTLREDFATVLRRLAERPVTTGVLDAYGRPRVLGAREFAAAVYNALLSHDRAAELPYRIRLAYLERWDELARIAQAEQAAVAELDELAMSFVIRCGEPWARFDPAAVARNGATAFERETLVAWAEDQAAACRGVPAAVIEPGDAGALVSTVPALLLVGGADPQDPIENVAGAPTDLPRSETVVVPGHGHTVAHVGCVGDVVSAFVIAGTADGLDASCITRGGAPLAPFRVP